MSKTFEQGRDEVIKLSEYFTKNQANFNTPGCKEAHVRQDLIDPLFRALGWDVGNASRVSPHLVEVKVEDSLDVEGQNKAPDYAFRVGEQVRFYVEAKKCGVNIVVDPAPAYQLRRYGWSAKVAVSILTNFEELSVYDCTTRPRPNDKPSRSRILYYRYGEYPDRWRELWDIFSREAVWTGGFDQYAASKRKRGTSEVDNEFLKEIEGWRDELARNIALRNRPISSEDLNRAVQLTIDRVVFLRMAEDRGLEPEHQLLKLSESSNSYPRFIREICRRADDKYNSGLFHFHKEPGVSESPDTLTPQLTVDDKVFKTILQSLYFEHGSPYHFGVLPVEILGTVYERFLGKVIRLTPSGQARVEEKPEVRKAGGVYYTPAYIVKYIVRQTVGRQIEGKSPARLAGKGKSQPLRVLDMACGSGSFLLGGYQCLLDYYLKWYIDHGPKKFSKAVYATRAGEWRLAISEKKRILTTHLYGVDIDPQAVEVTKLSLLLKVLEGESAETIGETMRLFHERALPNLSDNIKCGNSLIGPDYFAGRLIEDPEELARVNAFDWKKEFPAAFSAKTGGGFDCIIGNPPYVRILNLVDHYPEEVRFIQSRYSSASFGKIDLYVPFIQRAMELLRRNGHLGFIVPNKFAQSDYGRNIRDLISTNLLLDHYVDFRHAQVFHGATTYTCLLFLRNSENETFTAQFQTGGQTAPEVLVDAKTCRLKSMLLSADAWSLDYPGYASLAKKLSQCSTPLAELASEMITGVKTGANDVFVLDVHQNEKLIDQGLKAAVLRAYLKAENMRRYAITQPTRYLVYPYRLIGNGTRLLSENQLTEAAPAIMRRLAENRNALEGRQKGKLRGPSWYGLSFASSMTMFASEKIVTPTLAPRSRFALDVNGFTFPQGAGGGMGIVIAPPYSSRYVLGLLNATLLTYFFHRISSTFQGGWYAYEPRYVSRIPIRTIDFSNKADKAAHDRVVKLVDSMLNLHKQHAAAKSYSQQGAIQRQIEATDSEIDRLVYALYGLTDEEIHIVEESTKMVAK